MNRSALGAAIENQSSPSDHELLSSRSTRSIPDLRRRVRFPGCAQQPPQAARGETLRAQSKDACGLADGASRARTGRSRRGTAFKTPSAYTKAKPSFRFHDFQPNTVRRAQAMSFGEVSEWLANQLSARLRPETVLVDVNCNIGAIDFYNDRTMAPIEMSEPDARATKYLDSPAGLSVAPD